MLFATYQPRPESLVRVERNEAKWDYFKSEFGFEPYWCMPVTSVADFFCHSIFTAPNCGEVLYFVESDEYVRIDKIKHYQKIQTDGDFDLTGCVNSNLDDKYSEFIIPSIENFVAMIPIAGLESLTANPFFNFFVKASFDVALNNAIRKDLNKYINMGTLRPAEFRDDNAWAASMDMTLSEFQYRMYLEKGKMAFESVLLPFVTKQLLGDMVSPYDIHAVQTHFNKQRELYMKFSRWSYGECSLDEYDVMYDEMRNLVIDNSAVCAVLANGQKLGRNDMCPCGSGKKWKKCHGRLV